ncbi:unnamed protein product [Rotaria magnacalcarata]|uniref:Uncharacterized protein n=1 Tax=Rotaria magnacalcarata TaxID=392030 RepID=A0A819EPD3_9BILA|nr:unnamed protein product [Rotaria magnacalcarata]CAF1670424.1 unnamed protein product [Rotaria magnacalcarata]CAF2046746.1 unnamed protein product [Rotaria magnacalcarata]CAF2069697.1 unnamed protein product [Rotaria magnacalcarata]CAF2123850.1 unnamed protein product [Rotaria magnacalcarata]
MYPREITSTPLWIRHKLPLSPQPPPNGDEKLRNQIRSQNVQSTDETIEYYVRQERARLDVKWCLDEFFYWNVSNPSLGQLVIANIFERVHIAYIIEIHPRNVKVALVDMLLNTVMIGLDDIYTAEDSPFYEQFLLNQHLLHSQHVLDYIANEKLKNELIGSNHDISFDTAVMEPITQYVDIE